MKVIANNRKALHDYIVMDTYEAGVVLEGSEVKSLRQGAVSMSDGYTEFRNGEIFLFNLHISPYKFSSALALNPKRKRKLLFNKGEIRRLYGVVQQKGSTLVPLKIYFNDRGYAKISIGVCRRKRQYDKKEKILTKETEKSLSKLRRISR